MSYSTQKVGDVWVFGLRGEVWGGWDQFELKDSVAEVVEQGARRFLIDLGGTQYVTSIGIGILVAVHSMLESRHLELKLCSASSRTKRALEVTRVWQLFDTYEDRALALRSFGPVPIRVA